MLEKLQIYNKLINFYSEVKGNKYFYKMPVNFKCRRNKKVISSLFCQKCGFKRIWTRN